MWIMLEIIINLYLQNIFPPKFSSLEMGDFLKNVIKTKHKIKIPVYKWRAAVALFSPGMRK